MRMSFIIILTLLLVGCPSTRQSASPTAEQAKTVAMRLANDKAFTVYHCQSLELSP
jgi:PBP1b-binding outer membrane lipoprotein LpoB